jgi:hypothetical protein
MLTALLLGPLVAAALLHSSLQQQSQSFSNPNFTLLPPSWRIEPPAVLHNPQSPSTSVEALVLARRSLVDISTVCSTILLTQVSASWWYESRFRASNAPEGERASVPRREGKKFGLHLLFTFVSTIGVLCLRALAAEAGLGIWQSTHQFPTSASAGC